MIETQVKNALADETDAGPRVYPLSMRDRKEYPAIVYQRVGSSPVNSLSGYSGKESVRVQIDCYAATYGAAKALAGQVRTRMATLVSTPQGEIDLYENDTNPKLYRVTLDFNIWN